MNEALIGSILIAIVLIVILMILVSCIKIVPQATAMVVERLGGYKCTWSVGLHVKAPFIDRVAKRVILKEQVVDFAPQPVITKDNVRCGSIRLSFSRSPIRSFSPMVWKIPSWPLKT